MSKHRKGIVPMALSVQKQQNNSKDVNINLAQSQNDFVAFYRK